MTERAVCPSCGSDKREFLGWACAATEQMYGIEPDPWHSEKQAEAPQGQSEPAPDDACNGNVRPFTEAEIEALDRGGPPSAPEPQENKQ